MTTADCTNGASSTTINQDIAASLEAHGDTYSSQWVTSNNWVIWAGRLYTIEALWCDQNQDGESETYTDQLIEAIVENAGLTPGSPGQHSYTWQTFDQLMQTYYGPKGISPNATMLTYWAGIKQAPNAPQPAEFVMTQFITANQSGAWFDIATIAEEWVYGDGLTKIQAAIGNTSWKYTPQEMPGGYYLQPPFGPGKPKYHPGGMTIPFNNPNTQLTPAFAGNTEPLQPLSPVGSNIPWSPEGKTNYWTVIEIVAGALAVGGIAFALFRHGQAPAAAASVPAAAPMAIA